MPQSNEFYRSLLFNMFCQRRTSTRITVYADRVKCTYIGQYGIEIPFQFFIGPIFTVTDYYIIVMNNGYGFEVRKDSSDWYWYHPERTFPVIAKPDDLEFINLIREAFEIVHNV